MVARIANGDLVVIIPGILGSTLNKGPHQTWGYRQIVSNVHRLASRLTEDLSLPADAFTQPHLGYTDGTQFTGVLRSQQIIPGFIAVAGYDKLAASLRRKFHVDRGSIYEFAYDWRLSIEYSAECLRQFVTPLLKRRRQLQPEAKLVLIGHSMGGLVAHYFASCLDPEGNTGKVVTIGTPFMGAIKAFSALVNGFVRLGPIKLDIGELVRSFPSVAELLPTFRSFAGPGGDLSSLEAASGLRGLPAHALSRSLEFHRKIATALDAATPAASYYPLLSFRQPTETWASFDAFGELTTHLSSDIDEGGDGTVARQSGYPQQWTDDSGTTFIDGRHSSLHQKRATLTQIFGILTGHRRRAQADFDSLAVQASDFVVPGEVWRIVVDSVESSNALILNVTMDDVTEGIERVESVALRPCGSGRYQGDVVIRKTGTYRWTVSSQLAAATPVESISDIVMCASE